VRLLVRYHPGEEKHAQTRLLQREQKQPRKCALPSAKSTIIHGKSAAHVERAPHEEVVSWENPGAGGQRTHDMYNPKFPPRYTLTNDIVTIVNVRAVRGGDRDVGQVKRPQ